MVVRGFQEQSEIMMQDWAQACFDRGLLVWDFAKPSQPPPSPLIPDTPISGLQHVGAYCIQT